MVLENVAQNILDFVNYGITLIVLMLLWEVFKFFSGPSAVAAGGTLAGGVKDLLTRKAKKWAHGDSAKLLNEYLEEQKETSLLHDTVESAEAALTETERIIGDKEIADEAHRDEYVELLKDVGHKLDAARGQYRQVKRATFRQERKTGELLEKLDDRGMDTKGIKALENNILKLHQECIVELDTVLTHYGKIKSEMRAVEKLTPIPAVPGAVAVPTWPVDISTIHAALLNKIKTNLEDAKYKLTAVYNKQLQIDKEVQGIISHAKRLWA